MTLELFDSRDTAPNLAARLERHRDILACNSASEALVLAQPSGKKAIRNRYWAWRLYETTLPGALYWWTVSLPFRFAASARRTSRWERAA